MIDVCVYIYAYYVRAQTELNSELREEETDAVRETFDKRWRPRSIYLFGLKLPCAPKWNDFEFPIIKTTKVLVETRSGTWAKRI